MRLTDVESEGKGRFAQLGFLTHTTLQICSDLRTFLPSYSRTPVHGEPTCSVKWDSSNNYKWHGPRFPPNQEGKCLRGLLGLLKGVLKEVCEGLGRRVAKGGCEGGVVKGERGGGLKRGVVKGRRREEEGVYKGGGGGEGGRGVVKGSCEGGICF